MIKIYEVGGCVRDEILGIPSKDIDFTVEAESFEAMRTYMVDNGFRIFKESPEYFTIRAHFPDGEFLAGRDTSRLTADFVLARKEGTYTDGRRPDSVQVGTIYDDLARRDFTMNAIARDVDGWLIDPFGGVEHIRRRQIHAVGNAFDRFTEDSLRALRAIRFSVTKNFFLSDDIERALQSEWLPPLLANVSTERKREELEKMFRADTLESIELLDTLPRAFREAVFTDGLRLSATMKE